MCEDLKLTTLKEITGYKVVAEKNGRYYSPAMGIRYHNGKLVKIPKRQNRIAKFFNTNLLRDPDDGYRDKMVGRTAILTSVKDADLVVRWLHKTVPPGYNIEIRKAKVTDGLMRGMYGGLPVYAGRRITFR